MTNTLYYFVLEVLALSFALSLVLFRRVRGRPHRPAGVRIGDTFFLGVISAGIPLSNLLFYSPNRFGDSQLFIRSFSTFTLLALAAAIIGTFCIALDRRLIAMSIYLIGFLATLAM